MKIITIIILSTFIMASDQYKEPQYTLLQSEDHIEVRQYDEYIIARHSDGELKPEVSDESFPDYLQWFHYCEGMIMPPMNTIVVHTLILPEERRNEEVLRQAKNLLTKALLPIEQLLEKNKYLIDKFSGVDFMLGHSLFMSNKLKCVSDEMKNIKRYLNLISEREAFQKAIKT